MFKEHRNTHPSHFPFHAAGGHRGPRHGGGRGHGFGRGFGRGDFPAGRKLSSEELQLVLLALLEQQASHGYELIKMLEEKSGGFYAPSPGMVYPALTFLDEGGLATSTQEGNRKLYSLTPEGKAHLDTNRDHAETILALLARIGSRMSEVREAFDGVDQPGAPVNDAFHEARHALKKALMRKRGCPPAELERITQILKQAATDIVGKPD
ncbi:PadR family transcriptional regulator [Acetobacter orientalis]|uniref:PadR family transcriptional regulator n=1 Tax=Acetobacter orientalis TaxID=146474 RepID=UPI0039EB1B5B